MLCIWYVLLVFSSNSFSAALLHRIDIRHLGKLAASYFCLYSRTLILDGQIDSKVRRFGTSTFSSPMKREVGDEQNAERSEEKRKIKGAEKKICTNEIKRNGCEQTIWQNRKISLNKKKTKPHRISNNNNCGKIPWAEIQRIQFAR